MLFIPILLGTVRQGRQSELVANLILKHIQSHYPDIETALFDPRNMDLPSDDEGTELADRNQDWRDAMKRADGLIIEVHPCPEEALCDGAQALTPAQYLDLVSQVRAIHDVVSQPAQAFVETQ